MRSLRSVFLIIGLVLSMAFIVGCPAANSPSAPAPPADTATFTPTACGGGTASCTPTFTPTSTATFTPSFTSSATATPSFTPTHTPTFTPTFTPSSTPTHTPTSTATFTPTATQTACPFTGAMGLGTTSPGSTSGTVYHAMKYGLAQTSSAHAMRLSTMNACQVVVAIYGDGGSSPSTLITASTAFTAPGAGSHTIDIPDVSLPPGFYWLAVGETGGTFPSYILTGNTNIPSVNSNLPSTGVMQAIFPANNPVLNSVTLEALLCGSGPINPPTPTSTPTVTPTSTTVAACGVYGMGVSTGASGTNTNYIWIEPVGLPAGQAVSLRVTMSGPNASLSLAIYDDVAGYPGTILSQAPAQAVTAGVNTMDIPDVFVNSATYWLAYWSPNVSSIAIKNDIYLSYRFISNGTGVYPDPFPAGAPASQNNFVLEAVVCP